MGTQVMVVTAEVTGNAAGLLAAMEESGASVKSFKAETSSAAASASASTKSWGDSVSKAGLVAGAALAGAAVASVKLASDFQDSTSKLVTGAGESTKNLAMIRSGLEGMAPAVGMGPTALATAMFTVESAGYHGAAGLTVMKAAAEGAKIGGADATVVANGLTTALTDYHTPASDAANITSELVATVAAGKTTMADLSGSLANVLPAASAAGVGLKQVLGAMGTMTGEGISADQASQDLNASIAALSNPTSAQTKAMAQMGLSSLDVAKNLGKNGLTGTFDTLAQSVISHMGPSGLVLQSSFNQSKLAAQSVRTEITQLPKSLQDVAKGYADGTVTQTEWTKSLKDQPATVADLGREFAGTVKQSQSFNDTLKNGGGNAKTFNATMADMTGGQSGLSTALALTGSHMSTFQANTKTIGDSTKEADGSVKGWSETQKDFSTQIDQAGAAVKVMGITIGNALLPMIGDAVNVGKQWTQVLTTHPQIIEAILIVLASFVAIVAAAKVGQMAYNAAMDISKATILAYNLASGIMGTTTLASSVATATATELQDLNTESLAANAAAQKAYAVGAGIAKAATVAWTGVQTAFDAVMDANPIALIIIAIVAMITVVVLIITHWQQVVSFLKTAWGDIEKLASTVWKAITGNIVSQVTGNVKVITTVWNAAISFFTTTWTAIEKGVQVAWTFVTTLITTALLEQNKLIQDAWNGVIDFLGTIWDDIVGFVVTGGKDVNSLLAALDSSVVHFFSSAWNSAVGIVSSAGSAIVSSASGMVHNVASFFGSLAGDVSGAMGTFVNTISSGISRAVSSFVALPGKVTSGLGALTGDLVNVGGDMIRGLISGITSMSNAVVSAAKNVVQGAVNGAKALLGIHSPSTVFAEIGSYTAQGYIDGVNGKTSAIASVATTMAKLVVSAFNAHQISSSMEASTIKTIASDTAQLESEATARASVAAKLKTANTALVAAQKTESDYAASVTSSLATAYDASSATSSQGMIAGLTSQLQQQQQLQSDLSTLSKDGLNSTTYSQLVAGGTGSLTAADSLVSAGKSAVTQVNSLQSQLTASAKSVGTTAATGMYGAGVSAAQGIVKGLQSQETALDNEMKKIASTMTSAIKKELGIKSPSTVWRDEIGYMMGAGAAAGLTNSTPLVVNAAKTLLATPVLPSTSVGTGQITAAAMLSAAASNGGVSSVGGSSSTSNTTSKVIYVNQQTDVHTPPVDEAQIAKFIAQQQEFQVIAAGGVDV